jgi:hypothetical protein
VSRGHGRIQRRVVELLSADERARGEGLPLSALRPVLGPDRSNARRAIRSLIRRGDAEWATDPETGERRLKLEFWLCVAAMMNREEAERDGGGVGRALKDAVALPRARLKRPRARGDPMASW